MKITSRRVHGSPSSCPLSRTATLKSAYWGSFSNLCIGSTNRAYGLCYMSRFSHKQMYYINSISSGVLKY
jgi:hypothetical protein